MDDDYDPEAILADPDAPEIHKKIARINIGIRDRGEHWSKCANCGEPYQVTEAGNDTLCSDACEAEYIAYIMNPEGY